MSCVVWDVAVLRGYLLPIQATTLFDFIAGQHPLNPNVHRTLIIGYPKFFCHSIVPANPSPPPPNPNYVPIPMILVKLLYSKPC